MNGKRALDLVIVSVGGVVAVPLVAALALVTWLVDGRPVFFAQERVGKNGRRFRIWKLRTMTLEADPRERQPTRWGRWLRDRGLDELPQLLAIFRGEMSCVGPRPLTPDDLERLTALYPPFAERLGAKPGLTGLAQVCGARGVELCARVEAEYARRQGLWLDLAIILRTAWIHLVGKRRGRRPLPSAVEPPSARRRKTGAWRAVLLLPFAALALGTSRPGAAAVDQAEIIAAARACDDHRALVHSAALAQRLPVLGERASEPLVGAVRAFVLGTPLRTEGCAKMSAHR